MATPSSISTASATTAVPDAAATKPECCETPIYYFFAHTFATANEGTTNDVIL